MADLRIADAPEIALENITGNEKIPTGGYGNSAVTINILGQFAKNTLSLATEEYVSNALGQKENKITLTGLNLTPTPTLVEIPQTNNSVLNTIHQDLLNRMEWIKDNATVITDHQALTNRTAFNTHPSSSISHNGTSNVSIEIEELKNDVLTINTTTIPELENDIVGKQDVIVNDVNLPASSVFGDVPSTNNSALNNSLQSLINRDKFINDKIKTGLPPVFDQEFANAIGGYPLNARLMLDNGDIVQSTVANNINNPNVDMTGWLKENLASNIVDEDGVPINIKAIPNFNPSLEYVDGSIVIKDGMLQKYTNNIWQPKAVSYYDFGAKVDGVTDDTDAFIAYHKKFKKAHLDGRMHLRPIDIDQFITDQNLGLDISGDGNTKSYFIFDGEKGFYSAENRFFRNFNLKNLGIAKKNPTKTGIGIYIGSGGAEQINLEFVGYDGWGFGRATHQWNSSFVGEVYRDCKHPMATYGTSSDHANCYANRCTSPYLFGYAVSSDGVVTVPSIPFAYSDLSGIAADDCGNDGSVYKIGYCSGIDLNSLSCERAQGEYIFDLTDVSQRGISKAHLNNFSMYVNSSNPNIVGIFKSPIGKRPNFVIDGITIFSDKNIVLFSGNGSGCEIKNYSFNDKVGSSLTTDVSALTVNDVQIGDGVESIGEQGYILAANNDSYARVKNIKGRCFIDPSTQKLTFFAGSLNERLGAGIMVACKITLHPLNRNGNNSSEKHGEVLFSSAMDYNATDMSGHLNVVRTGTLTTLTTVSRNFSTDPILSFDLVVEATSPGTRFLIDFEYTYNGIQNINGKCWTVQSR